MKEKEVYEELSSIRELMERSSKFISLSGLSGILAGLYALVGAWFAFRIMDTTTIPVNADGSEPALPWSLILIAKIVFVLSVVTGYWLSSRKAKSRNENIWNPVSRRLLVAVAIPMITGGLFVSILLLNGEYTTIAAICLLFYGLALVAGSHYTFHEVWWLGIVEILLGLIALLYPEYGLLLWAVGFGVLHILYGTIMYFKYER